MPQKFLYGSAYYPEHWEESIRRDDPQRMREAGWNVVRMGEFAWDLIEPEEGRFDFAIFDETIARLGSEGIQTILCTPTATPPRWLTRKHPEMMRVNAQGVAMEHGSRQQASLAHSAFREHSRRITTIMAEHFRENPQVIGWQLDNEIHCQIDQDHSEAARQAFRFFLKKKFGNIQRLNQEWGTRFWALTYPDFDSVLTPKPDLPTYPNPSHLLDYFRFLSDLAIEFMREQASILRAANSQWWITHNGCFRNLDYRRLSEEVIDFLGYDSYPMFTSDANRRAEGHAGNLDGVRAWSGNFIILEQQSGPGGQLNYFLDTPEPGEMRAMAYRSIAHGADGVLFFRWRTCRFGAEEYWCGVLDHDNQPRRRYREAARLGEELAKVGPRILGTKVRIEVAIAGGAMEVESFHQVLSLGLPSPGKIGEEIHHWFYRHHHAVGMIHPEDDFAGIRLLWIPHWALFKKEWVQRLESWVVAGGTLVIGARTGTHLDNGQVCAETPPGLLQELTGVRVEEYGKQNHPESRPLELRLGETNILSSHWYEELIPEVGTQVLGIWESRHLKGRPAVTQRLHGAGRVIYVGTYMTAPVVEALMEGLGGVVGPVAPGIPEGVEVTVRESRERRLWFIVNGEKPAVWKNPPSGRRILDSVVQEGVMSLAMHEVVVIEEMGGC